MDYCSAVIVALVCLSSPTISRTYFELDSYDEYYEKGDSYIDEYSEDDHVKWHQGDRKVNYGADSSDSSKVFPPEFDGGEENFWETDYESERQKHGHKNYTSFNYGDFMGYQDNGYSEHQHPDHIDQHDHHDHNDHHNHHNHHGHYDYKQGHGHNHDNKYDNHEHPGQNAGHSGTSYNSQRANNGYVNHKGETKYMENVNPGEAHSNVFRDLILVLSGNQSSQNNQNGSSQSSLKSQNGSPQSSQNDQNGSPQSSQNNQNGLTQSSQKSQNGSPQSSQNNQNGSPQSSQNNQNGSPQSSQNNQNGSPQSSQKSLNGSPQNNQNNKNGLPESSEVDQSSQNNRNGSTTDADRLIFPDFTQARSTSPSRSSSPTEPPSSTPSATESQLAVTNGRLSSSALRAMLVCLRVCPVASNYNPVCGSNNFTYNNEEHLNCARNCGINLMLVNRGPCVRTAQDAEARLFKSTTARIGPEPAIQSPTPRTLSTTRPTRYTAEELGQLSLSDIEELKGVFDNEPSSSNNPITTSQVIHAERFK